MDLSKFVVRSGGKADKTATLAAFDKLLGEYLAKEAETTGQVADAVNTVFDKYKGAAINMPALCSMSAELLGADKDNWQTLADSAKLYVQQNSQGDKAEDGTVENPESLFVIAKGRGGGVKRRADITPAA